MGHTFHGLLLGATERCKDLDESSELKQASLMVVKTINPQERLNCPLTVEWVH